MDINGVKLISYFDPIKQDMNPLSMTTSFSVKAGTSKHFLESLYKLLGDQYIVSAEYKVDLFFNTPERVRTHLFVIRRYLYVTYGPTSTLLT